MQLSGAAVVIALSLALSAPAYAQQAKSADDPTRIATKLGAAYSGDLYLSGSLAIGPKFKFNGRMSPSGLWSVGASYLLPVAILTVAAGKSSFDSGVEQTKYSVGGFVPLSQLGLKTGRFQLFVPFGYAYTNGKQVEMDQSLDEDAPMAVSSNSAYVGLMSLYPLSEKFTWMAGGNVSKGTRDYSGASVATGLSYHITGKDTVGVRASYVNNSFGQKTKLGVSYRHEF